MKMLHTCIRVQDLEASLAFYDETLGLKEVSRNDFPEAQFTLVYLRSDDSDYELELTYNYGHEAYDLGNGYGHIAVGVDNLEESHEKHLAQGIPTTDLMGLPGQVPLYYFIQDPDGYKIEVIDLNRFRK